MNGQPSGERHDPDQPEPQYGQQPADPRYGRYGEHGDQPSPTGQPGEHGPPGQPWSQGPPEQSWSQGPPPGAYPPPSTGGYPHPPPTTQGTNVMAVLSLVFAFLFAPAGIVLGHLAKRQIRQTREAGDQLATWGLILGYVFTALYLIVCCGWLGLVIWAGSGRDGGTYG